ncbi:hypothetical protein OSTOST_20104, partial [Ostertagia ostertagi]
MLLPLLLKRIDKQQPACPNSQVDPSRAMSTRQHRAAEKCRCCPYGFHIDVDFVAYAEDVTVGGTSRTPTLPRKHGERSLMSPLDSIF